jgi:putative tricarboxylic transport membrane protein
MIMPVKYIAAGLALALSLGGPALADDYPSRPIEIFVHSGPGSGVDVLARTMAHVLDSEGLVKQPITVQNKTGGGGANAIIYATHQEGNPYSLWIMANNFVTTKERGLPPAKFLPVALLETEYQVLAVRADSAFHSVQDLVDAAKKAPGEIALGIGAFANPDHQATYQLAQQAGVNFNYVLLQSGSQSVTALLAGDVDFTFGDYVELEGHLKAGTVRALGVSAPERLSFMPDVPTLKEQGFDVEQKTVRGVALPAGVSPDVVAFWEDRLERMTKTEAWAKYIENGRKVASFEKSAGFTATLKAVAETEGPMITALRKGP